MDLKKIAKKKENDMATLKQQVEELKKENEELSKKLKQANAKIAKLEKAADKSKQRATSQAATRPMRHV